MHVYKCARCGKIFETENYAERCPECGCKVLIHKEGERRRGKACSGCPSHNCASCGGCH